MYAEQYPPPPPSSSEGHSYSEESLKPHHGYFKNFSRPFMPPVYNPQQSHRGIVSNSAPGQSSTASTAGRTDTEDSVHSRESTVSFTSSSLRTYIPHYVWYGSDRTHTASRLGLDQMRFEMVSPTVPPIIKEPTPYRPMAYEKFKILQKEIEDGKGAQPPKKVYDHDSSEYSNDTPDGGLLAWAHALAGFIVCMNTQGLNMAFGVFQTYYEKVLLTDSSPSKIAWIGSFQLFMCFALCLVVGPLIGKGYFRICFHGGSAMLFGGLLTTSFCDRWWQLLLVQGMFVGISMGLIFSSATMIVTGYFSRKLGLATGIAAAGSSFGGIIFPLITKNAVFNVGFGWTIRIIALVNLVTMIPVNLVVRQRPGWKRTPAGSLTWAMFKDMPYLLMMAGMFFAFWGTYFGFYFISSFGKDVLKLDTDTSLSLLVVMNTANMVGRFIPNLISDNCIGPMNTLIPTTLLSSILVFLWTGVTTQSALFLVSCFYGFMAAGVQSLYTATVFSFAAPDSLNTGVRVGMVFAVIGIACLTGSPLGGQLIVLGNGDYLYAQIFAGTTIAVGGLFFLGSRLSKQGWRAERV